MEELIEFAKKRYNEIRIIQQQNKNDVYFAVVKSNLGKFYDSTPLHNGLCPICCERSAMAQMMTHEGETAKVSELVLIGAIGNGGILSPCGICRQTIYDNSSDAKIIICGGKFNQNEDCNFIFDNPKIYSIKELLPFAWKPEEW